MIAYLRGNILEKSATKIVLDCNGVGYEITIPTRLSEKLPEVGLEFSLPVFLVVREDTLQFFGFENNKEKQFFILLISISGIGPKTAIGILSAADTSKLRQYVVDSDIVALSKLPGIGKKTAERLVLELREKAFKIESDSTNQLSNFEDEALSALLTLGYNRNSSLKLIDKAVKSSP
ncbi:Holliday junction branch migration protein RuvA, partial [Candidatus Kapabacteria bacterium]|nr:Holliday junction branch migration protein RuvA [Candidatus Kapabacteria bacterium]